MLAATPSAHLGHDQGLCNTSHMLAAGIEPEVTAAVYVLLCSDHLTNDSVNFSVDYNIS